MAVKIGINPITWTNDDVPELGGDTPLETCLAETAQAGYRGTELGGKFPRTSSELGPILAAHKLELVSGWYDGRILDREVDEEFDAILPHLTLLRDLGVKRVVYADTSRGRHDAIHAPISQRPLLSDDEWADYGRKITKLAERFAEFGVAKAFHHHMGTIVETENRTVTPSPATKFVPVIRRLLSRKCAVSGPRSSRANRSSTYPNMPPATRSC